MDGLIVAIGLPITILCALSVLLCVVSMAWAFGSRYQKLTRYTLDQEWTSGDLLLSATESAPVALARHEPAGTDELTGGSAHGKW